FRKNFNAANHFLDIGKTIETSKSATKMQSTNFDISDRFPDVGKTIISISAIVFLTSGKR
ncbi:MAG: hypothetical protein FWH46_07170, partial [Methanimicrococcus sp.]|nr:hypothetical protein [Methanimicrococcus sp.]